MLVFKRVRSWVVVVAACVVVFLVAGLVPAQASVVPAGRSVVPASLEVPANTVVPAATVSGSFTDVPSGAQFFTEIQWLAAQGISTGWTQPDGTRVYKPLLPVARDAMAAFMYRLAGSPAFTAPAVSPFRDVQRSNQFYKEITWLASKGISTGWAEPDGSRTYRPLSPVARDAMAAFMYRYAGSPAYAAPARSAFTDVSLNESFYKQISWLAAQGISTGWVAGNGTKTFQPLSAVHRDAMAAFMYRFYRVTHPLVVTAGSLHAGVEGTRYLDQVAATGGIAPLVWTATGLPSGLVLTPDGAVSGIPTTTGSNTVAFTVTDAAGVRAGVSRVLNVPTTMPAECIGQSCAVLTPTARTVQVPSGSIVGITRDPATRKVATVTLTGAAVNGAAITTGQVLVLAPTPDIPSGAIVYTNTLATNPDGTVTAAVTPTTPADAYTQGTVNSLDPTIQSVASPMSMTTPTMAAPGAVSPRVAAGSKLSCDAGVTGTVDGLSVVPNMTSSVAAIWKHPIFGFGGVYVGTGGLDLFQFDLDGTITVNLGASLSGKGQCTLTLPTFTRAVPAGNLGAVILSAQPKISLKVSGKLAINSYIGLKCGAEYRWSAGTPDRTTYCTAISQPLAFTSDTGAQAVGTATIDTTVSLDDVAGITGQLNGVITANYTPTQHPIATIDGSVGFELGACLACFWSDAPTRVTMVTGTFFHKRIATYDTPIPPTTTTTAPLAITTTTLPAGTTGTPYRATLTATGGTSPYTWAITAGTLPPGLTLEPTTGTITGTPTTAVTTSITAAVTDNKNTTVTHAATLIIGTAANFAGVKSIAAGYESAYAFKNDGTVWAWGNNTYGQLGNGTTTDSSVPVQVKGLTGVRSLSAQGYNTYALMSDGSVRAWGDNTYGQLGNGTTINSSVPVQVTDLTGAVSVTAGNYAAFALMRDGTVRAWGQNGAGQLGNGTTSDSSVPVQVTGLTGATTLTVSQYRDSIYALMPDGSVWAWGQNQYGELGNGSNSDSSVPSQVSFLTGAASVTVGDYSAYALMRDGTVRAWGFNKYGQLGDGTLDDNNFPTKVTGIASAISLTTGDCTAYALLSDGTVRAWGNNWDGQLGNGTHDPSRVPVQVTGLAEVRSLNTSGQYAVHALAQDGTVFAWGSNWFGLFGNGSFTQSSVPVQVTSLTGATSLITTVNGDCAYALMPDGTVRAWGDNTNGQLGNGTTTDSSVPVQVGATAGR